MSRPMGVHIEAISHEERFNTLQHQPVIVNDYDITSEEDKLALNDMLFTEYDSDTLSAVPSCTCGHLTGGEYEGMVCRECHAEVRSITERPLESVLWLRVPEGIHAFISPAAWRKLAKLLHIPNFDTMTYLTDPQYQWKANSRVVQKFLELDLPRGLNAFYEHFDRIIEAIFASSILKVSIRDDIGPKWIAKHRDKIFTRYLPIPSKMVFVVEKSAIGQSMYADLKMKGCLDAIRTISSIETATLGVSDRVKNARTVKAIKQLADFYYQFYKANISGKPGWLRKSVYGSRLDFTARAVISSVFGPHAYDELILPWGLSVELMRLHLMSKLLRRGYAPNAAKAKINESIRQYDPLISELLDELINETRDGYLNVLLQRNPSLVRGSGQKFKVRTIRRDPNINTIGFSVLTTKAPNADYDGDQMNLTLLTDDHLSDQFEELAPHKNVFDLNTPLKVSDNVGIPAPVLSTVVNWMHRKR